MVGNSVRLDTNVSRQELTYEDACSFEKGASIVKSARKVWILWYDWESMSFDLGKYAALNVVYQIDRRMQRNAVLADVRVKKW